MRALKIFFSIIILIAIVLGLAISALVFFLDPNKLKPVIIAEVKKQTGYQLTINGRLHWSFYPRIGIKIQRLTLAQPQQAMPIIDLRDVRVGTSLSSLFNKNMKLQGAVFIGQIKLDKINLQNAHMNIHWQNEVLNVAPISAALYDGSISGSIQGTHLKTIPHWHANVKLEGISLQLLWQDLAISKKISFSGEGSIHLQLSTEGKHTNQLLNHLEGVSQASIKKGILHGINLNYLVQSAEALMNKQPLPLPTLDHQTPFSHLITSATIKNGVVDNNYFILTSTSFVTTAKGTINLPTEMLDYQLQINPLVPGRMKWNIPVDITGDYKDPTIRLDISALNNLMIREKLEKVKARINKEVKQLPVQVDQFLQKILGQ